MHETLQGLKRISSEEEGYTGGDPDRYGYTNPTLANTRITTFSLLAFAGYYVLTRLFELGLVMLNSPQP